MPSDAGAQRCQGRPKPPLFNRPILRRRGKDAASGRGDDRRINPGAVEFLPMPYAALAQAAAPKAGSRGVLAMLLV